MYDLEVVLQAIPGTDEQDLYKITMGQAVYNHYRRGVTAGYRFYNRGKTQFPEGFADRLRELVNEMAQLTFSPEVETYLRTRCAHYLDETFIDWLITYRYNPDEVKISQTGGDLEITIEGPWYRTIYWEVPLLALISELYYDMMSLVPRPDFEEIAFQKGKTLAEMGAYFAEFGLRRRASRTVQRAVLRMLIQASGTHLIGTSNVSLASEFQITPIGTHAHEWFMAHMAIFGHEGATREALHVWAEEFRGNLGIALTDTFTTPVFLRSFDRFYAMLFDGLRWDSHDAKEWLDQIEPHYQRINVDLRTKQGVFTDGLNIPAVGRIQEISYGRIIDRYGIGTYLSNDVGHKALNIVIKMDYVILPTNPNKIYVVKFSDSPGKVTGNPEAVATARAYYGIKP